MRGRAGRRRKADDACAGKKHGISYEEYCAGKREVWTSGEGRDLADTFYQIEKNDIGRKLCDESAETGKSDQKVCAL